MWTVVKCFLFHPRIWQSATQYSGPPRYCPICRKCRRLLLNAEVPK